MCTRTYIYAGDKFTEAAARVEAATEQRGGLLYGMPGMEPGSARSKANVLSTMLLSVEALKIGFLAKLLWNSEPVACQASA